MSRYYDHLAEAEEIKPQPGDDPQGLLYLSGRYLEWLRVHHWSSQTIYGNAKYLRYFRLFCQQLGITQARQITRAVMVSYQTYLYHYRKTNGMALGIATQKSWLIVICGFFSWLTKQGHIFYNPASDLQMPRGEYRLPKAILSASEVETILNIPELNDPIGLRDRAILETLYSTGIRRAEVCQINLGDVDYGRLLLRVEQGKGRKDRFVPIGERALKWIEKYLTETRPRFCPALNEQALFLNTLGQRMTPGRLGSQIHAIIDAAQTGKTGSCHLFRHTFATLLLEAGCDIRYVQEMLGHANLKSTQIYTHVSLKTLQEVHARFHPAKLPEEKKEKSF